MARRMLGRKNSTKDIKAIRALNKITDSAIACRVYNNADFTHDSTGNYLAITFNAERRDAMGLHSTITNASRITFTLGGWYLVGGGVVIAANATGVRRLAIRLGGATYIAVNQLSNLANVEQYLTVSSLYYFAAADYVELMVYQNSGGDLDITASASFSPEFWVMRLPFNDAVKGI